MSDSDIGTSGSGTQGAWAIEPNEDDTGLVISFQEMNIDGVQVFTTAMPPADALRLGENIVTEAKAMLDDAD